MVGLRDKRTQYSWALQGGGIGVLYLTIFAAMKLYQLIPVGPAFALLAAVAFLSAFIAVKQSAMPLTILGIAYVAFHKNWRPLNELGWGFTFIIGTLPGCYGAG